MEGPPALAHLRRMTDETGLYQHAWRDLPDRHHGYTLDDNARALAVALGLQRLGADTVDLVDRYLQFIRHAQQPGGWFHNFLGYDRRWLDDVATGDAHGHAVAALGYASAAAPQGSVRDAAALLVEPALSGATRLRSPRAIAHSVIGLCWLVHAGRLASRQPLDLLATRLVTMYDAHAEDGWEWYEPVLAYDNGRLPLAMLLAFDATGERRYGEVAGASLGFLVRQVYRESATLDLIGNHGWWRRGQRRAVWDQQPVDAASMAEVTAAAAQTIGPTEQYRSLAVAALAWFQGRNRLQVPVHVPETGACHDALTADGVNDHQGAESVLALFQAWLAVHEPSWTVPPG
jgi:hypothetical protein